MNVDTNNLHNPYLYLLESHGVDEVGDMFQRVGIKPASGGRRDCYGVACTRYAATDSSPAVGRRRFITLQEGLQ